MNQKLIELSVMYHGFTNALSLLGGAGIVYYLAIVDMGWSSGFIVGTMIIAMSIIAVMAGPMSCLVLGALVKFLSIFAFIIWMSFQLEAFMGDLNMSERLWPFNNAGLCFLLTIWGTVNWVTGWIMYKETGRDPILYPFNGR